MRIAIALAAGVTLAGLLGGCGNGSGAAPPREAPKARAPSEVVIKYCTG